MHVLASLYTSACICHRTISDTFVSLGRQQLKIPKTVWFDCYFLFTYLSTTLCHAPSPPSLRPFPVLSITTQTQKVLMPPSLWCEFRVKCRCQDVPLPDRHHHFHPSIFLLLHACLATTVFCLFLQLLLLSVDFFDAGTGMGTRSSFDLGQDLHVGSRLCMCKYVCVCA